MSVTVEEFVAKLGWKTDTTALKSYQKSMSNITSNFVKMGSIIGTLFTGAMSKLMIDTNRATEKQYVFARSIGTTADELEQWGAVMESTELSAENIGTQMIFLSRKMGEVKLGKGEETIKKLEALGVDMKNFKTLGVADQYKTVIKSALAMGDTQKAAATLAGLTDRMGMNAAKMLMYLDSTGKPIEELLSHYEALDLNTQHGEESSVRFMRTWRDITFAVSSAKQEFFSLLVEALTPMGDSMVTWIKANRELIKSRLKYWAQEIAKLLKTIYSWSSKLIGVMGSLTGKVGGFNNAIKLAVIAIAAFKVAPILNELSKLAGKDFASGIIAQLKTLKGPLAFGGLAAIIALAAEDIYTTFTGGDSLGNRISWYLIGLVQRTQLAIFKMFGYTEEESRKLLRVVESGFATAIDKLPERIAFLGSKIVAAFKDIGNGIATVLAHVPILGRLLGISPDVIRNIKPGGTNYGNPNAGARNVLTKPGVTNTNQSKSVVVNNSINISGANADPKTLGKIFRGELESTMNRTLLATGAGQEY